MTNKNKTNEKPSTLNDRLNEFRSSWKIKTISKAKDFELISDMAYVLGVNLHISVTPNEDLIKEAESEKIK